MGADVRTLVRVLTRNGGVRIRRLPQALLALGAALARWPATAIERRWVQHRIRPRSVPGRPPEDDAPLFIVGHWRSGTTHLYNILSKAPALGFVGPLETGMPWEFLGLVRIMRPLLERALPEDRFIDRIPVDPDSPQEDETALSNMQPISFYHGLYFPERFRENFERGVFLEGVTEEEMDEWIRRFLHFVAKLRIQQGERRLIIKNPVYTARIALLSELFPEARFIHIHRNPYEVFQSMRGFYEVLFATLALQDFSSVDVDEVILDAYPRMMTRCVEEAADLRPERFFEMRYDDLGAEPIEQIAAAFEALELEGFREAEPRFREYLASVRSYKTRDHRFAPDDLARVRERWGAFIDRWGYGVPS